MVLKHLENQRNLLVEAGAPPEAVNAFANVLLYLHRLPKADVEAILLGGGKRALRSNVEAEAELYRDASLEEVEAVLGSSELSRKSLEAILLGRFQYPKGSLKSAGNMDQLMTLIESMIDNERTHSVIAEVASRDLK
ncbi:hypothetical protein U0030_12580 [Brevundimonas bullata]|uniref:hypothetical protein n=1 Tax=Brevundimonas bullata TaxID=13160 RepID=UPI001FE75BD4|nr:hypothetical protein [Brevundimonas bullata]WQE36098.1 hypothetical protein U0030_12580 [Brevundimonas bullata]